ncbi:hypothetical protein [Arsenophonus sp. PmNCSU2021_1]|uniref:hypothetical protein n=1 Tax=Arsenophonus sp. PmNCSU2021_1 TaxID=3118989 RepID=UPI002FF36263
MPLIVKRFSVGEYKDIVSDESVLKIINSAKKKLPKNAANTDTNESSVVKKNNNV